MKNESHLLSLLLHGNQLKNTIRTGWTMRGIAHAENVAAHSYGVTFIALVLLELLNQPLNRDRVLQMAILHDLPEGLTTDIPTPSWRLMPSGIKTDVERSAITTILDNAPFRQAWLEIWEELHANQTAEAQLVHDADKLEMYVQAWRYEQETGNKRLAEFWHRPFHFHFPIAQVLYDQIVTLRKSVSL